MKIALLGYGKMGKEIEKIALVRGHEISVKFDIDQDWVEFGHLLPNADVAIDFSMPACAVDNIYRCFEANIPVIVGTTGWLDKTDEIRQYCNSNNKTMMYSSNYSIGVNIFFEINKRLAKLLNNFEEYDVKIEEIHHTQKLDAPSGTAITIANGIMQELIRKKQWLNQDSNQPDVLPIISKRIAEVPGTHIVEYDCPIDTIEIKHTAKNRQGFAKGAVLAAEWIIGKTGFLSINDMLNF